MLPLNKRNLIDKEYWVGLEVHFDKINDQWKETYLNKLGNALKSMNLNQLKELCDIAGIKYVDKKEELVNIIVSNDEIAKLLYYLKDFQSKKKKAINEFYEWLFFESEKRYDLSTLSKLYHLYKEGKNYLFDIYTIYKWGAKGSGNKYINKKIFKNKDIIEIVNNIQYIKKITDTMHSKSKNHDYKLIATATYPNHKIVALLYKQMADVMLPDFDGNKNNKKVSEIMFEIDLDDKSVSIKSSNNVDEGSLIEYFDKSFHTNLEKYKKETFSGFSKKKFEEIFSDSEISERLGYPAYISSICFNSSPLWKSPSITFDLKDDDVWPAVVEANKAGMIRPKSLKDIKYLKLTLRDHTSKKLYTNIEQNGDVTFRLQDANLTKNQIQETNDNFEFLFGLPINQPVSNDNFTEGTADKVDFILKSCNPSELGTAKVIFDELVERDFINETNISGHICSNEDCQTFYEYLPESECEECGHDGFKSIQKVKFNLCFTNIKTYIKNKITEWTENSKKNEYKMLKPTYLTLYGKKYEFYNIENNYQSIQILVLNEILPARVINRLRKLLTPTIVIYVGYQEFDYTQQNSDSIYTLNFGQIYSYEGKELYNLLENVIDVIDSRAMTIVTQASSTAYETLLALSENEDTYTAGEFEDDIFAILKDIFPNADKWGRDMSGERVPEGLFSLQYSTQIGANTEEFRRIYSFDCKLTKKEKGYDLGISEKRKAWDYIDELHKIRDITKYSDKKEVSGHIFITNKYKHNQIDEMRKFFNEKMSDKISTIPIFIEVEQIILLHKLYRQNYKEILIRRNTFYEEINKLLIQEDGVITVNDILDCFNEILEQEPEQRHLDMNRVRKKIKKGGKVGRS
ncbi:hypothetical protein ABER75_11130 [Niallia taxi]|uniref:hypothetical protein n=1 Tax=Niallia taxi TaxID=2499688 RepID=UPI003D2AE689